VQETGSSNLIRSYAEFGFGKRNRYREQSRWLVEVRR
jgi:hypothetical protein